MRGGELFVTPKPDSGRPKGESSWRSWLIPIICMAIAGGLIVRAIQKRSPQSNSTLATDSRQTSRTENGWLHGTSINPSPTSSSSLPQYFPDSSESQPRQQEAWVEIRSAVRSCFPDEAMQADRAGGLPAELSSASLEAVFGPLRKKESLTRIEHLRFANGGERRLRVSLESQADDGVRPILRVYDVDPEGLPIPLKIPDSHMRSPNEDLLISYRQGATIAFQQYEWGVSYASGAVGQLIETNGEIRGVQVRLRGKLLHCVSSSECECL